MVELTWEWFRIWIISNKLCIYLSVCLSVCLSLFKCLVTCIFFRQFQSLLSYFSSLLPPTISKDPTKHKSPESDNSLKINKLTSVRFVTWSNFVLRSGMLTIVNYCPFLVDSANSTCSREFIIETLCLSVGSAVCFSSSPFSYFFLLHYGHYPSSPFADFEATCCCGP